MEPYTLIFFSSSTISLPLLNALHSDARFKIMGLICQPDKEEGRHLELQEHEIKKIAVSKGIPVYQPERLSKDETLLEELKKNPPDFLLTFSYGQFLSKAWLELPKRSPLNVHPSLLPKYRGPTPIQSALLNGDTETGITLMKMTEGMDEGPIAAQFSYLIPSHITSGLLFEALGQFAAEKLPQALVEMAEKGDSAFRDQEGTVSLCKKIDREDGRMNFKESADQLFNRFRAYTPWPGIFTNYQGKRLKFLDLKKVDEVLESGKVRCDKCTILIGASKGALQVNMLQLEGKKALPAEAFILGQPEFCSAHLPS